MTHKKFGPGRFSRFDVYWIQTNKQTSKQTDRQTDKPNLYIDKKKIQNYFYNFNKLSEGNYEKYTALHVFGGRIWIHMIID